MDAEEIRLVGRRLEGRYELEDEIASGGMGTVWRARDKVLGRAVAVKVLHDHLARDPDLFDRFRLEAVAAARLTHPAVVKVFDTGIDGGVSFIVMELFEGRTLESLLAERGTLDPEEAARMVRSTLQGLGHAHRHGVVHRDVKPGNILIDRDGYVKVTDFGIAKAAFAGDDLTTTGNLLGTSRYLAPEQVTGGPVDARADLYS
ncbi:MAG: protein kinase domain-containing protein, partial [Actinomycetota bacterium]